MEFRLESFSPEMEYGTIVDWHKKVGDAVGRDETLVEVEADKVTHEVVAPVAGTLVDIIAAEGDEIRVGDVLAVIEESAQ